MLLASLTKRRPRFLSASMRLLPFQQELPKIKNYLRITWTITPNLMVIYYKLFEYKTRFRKQILLPRMRVL